MKNRENFYQKIIYLNLIFILFFSCGGGKKDNKNFKSLAALILPLGTSKDSSESSTNEKSPPNEKRPPNEKSPPEVEPVENLDIKDPLYKEQWHLKNTEYSPVRLKDGGETRMDINVEPIWKQGYFGKGMKVGIFDTPIEDTHPDLRNNLPLKNVMNSYPNDPLCQGGKGGDTHGTEVAGIIASMANDIGTRGIAPHATLYSYAVIRSSVVDKSRSGWKHLGEMLKAFNHPEINEIAVFNGSLSDGSRNERTYATNATEQKILKKFDQATREGFGGLGSSLVFASGNDATGIGSAANNQFLNHYAVMAVSSILGDGSIIATKTNPITISLGAETGTNLWLVAPTGPGGGAGKGLMTTDLVGTCGDDKGDYTSRFGASSGATPSVSGVIALLRQAYPRLSWRDVKLILAESAKKVAIDPAKDLAWKITGKMYSDSSKNQEYQRAMGFGSVDAGAAFELAENWKLLPTMKTETFEKKNSLNTETSDIVHSSTLKVQDSKIKFIESVILDLEIERTQELSLRYWSLILVSPDKKEAAIYRRYDDYFEAMYTDKNLNKFSFSANTFLGNSVVNGDWKLQLKQSSNKGRTLENTGKITEIKNWKLTIRGH